MREIYSQYENVDKDKTNNNIVDFEISYPWEQLEDTLSEKELKSRDMAINFYAIRINSCRKN